IFSKRKKNNHWKFFSYILFSNNFYEKDDEILGLDISAPVVALMCGCEDQYLNNHFNLTNFLNDFKKELPDFTWIEFKYNPFDKKKSNRTLLGNPGIDEQDRMVLEKDFHDRLIKNDDSGLVYMFTGEKYFLKKEAAKIKEIEESMKIRMTETELLEDQKNIIDYMNSRGHRNYKFLFRDNYKKTLDLFTKMKDNGKLSDEAIQVATHVFGKRFI